MIFRRAANNRRLTSPFCAHAVVFEGPALLACALLLCILSSHPAFAQGDAPADSDELIRVRTDLVTVPVLVTDAQGRRVSGLARDAFEVREEGRTVETSYFAAGAERVALLFLLDASGSTRDQLAQQRETALALFTRFGARSRVGVLHFREQPELVLPLTTDIERARSAFNFPALPDRRTAIFDAALAALDAFKADAPQPTERRIVILISDGLDTASTTRAAEVVEAAQRADASFYVIHLPLYEPRDGRLAPRRPAKGFRELAEKTGGQFFVAGDARAALDPHAHYNLEPVFRAIAEDLAGQYVLGYYASAMNGASEANGERRARRVEVRLAATDKRKLRVRPLREQYILKQ